MAKILLVGYVRELIEEKDKLFRSAGHEVTLATQLQEASQAAKLQMFDLAVLGFSVPETERNQLASAIKRKRPETKIVMLYFDSAAHTEFADVLIPAHVRPEELLRAVNYIINVEDQDIGRGTQD
jgi:CheY-like chemotaxis protein